MLGPSVYPVAALTAERSVCLPTAPANPPERKELCTAALPGEEEWELL